MSDLLALYARIDDAMLETMSSRGLMRRAAADAANVAFDSLGSTGIVGSVEGATVRLDDKGLAKARCTCPAATLCRHKLAVVLALRNQAAVPVAMADEPETDWLARLAAFDLAALQGAVGKTALREAFRLLALAETTAVEPSRSSLKVTLTSVKEGAEVAIPAQGDFAAIASGLPERRRPASHAAAVLAARSHFGLPAVEFAEATPVADEEAFTPDAALLAAILDTLRRAYAQGFSVPSRGLEERLMLLAISGRAEAMPRLSACLRRIAEGLEQRRTRNVNHDPVDLLREIAFGHALAYALSQTMDGQRLRKLAGAVRADYEPIGDVDLIGLGASVFETIAGAVGVTSHFIEPATGRRFTATLARSTTHDTRFDPRSAYGTEPVWGHTLSRLSIARFRLSGAQASDSGRLSLSQSSRTGQPEPFRPTQEAVGAWADDRHGVLADLAHQSWTILADTLARAFAPSLDRPPPSRPVILMPHRLAPVSFDDLTQTLRWPLMDRVGAWIALTLGHDDEGRGLGAHRIAALEAAVGDEGDRKPFAIVALARAEQGRIVLEPMSLWGETTSLLDFPDRMKPLETGFVSRIMTSLRRASAQFAPPPPVDTSARQTSQLLEAGVDALISCAEAGLQRAARERLLQPLAQTYELASLAPLMQLFTRTVGSTDEVAPAAALTAAHGLFTLQGLTCRLPVW
ncbi:hypothetical protein GCM10007874_24140 [Labrys miyagiensis]|uniref:SWIM-type domain-containing protein n=1 Tax=Labrys miyagiensis TaxID=346912 RepID=A0ABQ6CGC1_9HYPH|nr:SWIM zinc finger family protein [Labrys miyagiensis]GLS19397.1 hypothetical protein GCM10007874_24140 [Labrys miyagiensis]